MNRFNEKSTTLKRLAFFRGLKFVGIIFIYTVLILGAVEWGLRLIYYKSFKVLPNPKGLRVVHPSRGWTPAPGKAAIIQTLVYTVKIRINSKGLRDIEHSYQVPPGTFRIVILGDSFMEAFQVELQDSLPRLLEKKLKHRNVEVINFGVGAYGTAQEYLYLKEEVLKYKPNLVLMAFYPLNDTRNNSWALEKELMNREGLRTFGRPFAQISADGELRFKMPDLEKLNKWEKRQFNSIQGEANKTFWEKSVIYKFLNNLLRARKAININNLKHNPNISFGSILKQFSPASYKKPLTIDQYRKMWDRAWSITYRLISETSNLSEKNGAAFVLFTVPAKVQVDDRIKKLVLKQYPRLTFDLGKPNRNLLHFGALHRVRVLDLLPAFIKAHEQDKGPLFHKGGNSHWNSTGHRVAVARLIEYLENNRLIPLAPR